MSEEQSEKKKEKNVEKWDDLNLRENLLRGIYGYGFEFPSEIQKKAILPMISGGDLIAQAQSGSGKTGTFTISTLQKIDLSLKCTQALIIAPTHELAKQIAFVFESLGSHMEGLVVKLLIGGTSVTEDVSDLKANTPHIIVGCPGRIFDMIRRNHVNTHTIKTLCMDEADELLSGFKEQIYNIFQTLDRNIQVALFSATMPEEVLKLSEKFMRSPVKIMMTPETLNLECIHQTFIALMDDKEKYDTLKQLFNSLVVSQCIIYANSVHRVMELYRYMTEDGFSVGCIHSNMCKADRDKVFKEFRTGSCRMLISSNITARGIDVQQVSTVINFDIPNCVHTYLHRIGRSGRWGRKGLAINLITRRDLPMMKTIEKHYNSNIVEFVRET
jgi:translation initiation factor 4A